MVLIARRLNHSLQWIDPSHVVRAEQAGATVRRFRVFSNPKASPFIYKAHPICAHQCVNRFSRRPSVIFSLACNTRLCATRPADCCLNLTWVTSPNLEKEIRFEGGEKLTVPLTIKSADDWESQIVGSFGMNLSRGGPITPRAAIEPTRHEGVLGPARSLVLCESRNESRLTVGL